MREYLLLGGQRCVLVLLVGMLVTGPRNLRADDEAYAEVRKSPPGLGAVQTNEEDWPTFRHDPARHGATPRAVGNALAGRWRVKVGGGLTQPVVADGRVHLASRDTHTVLTLELATGLVQWTFTAGGRVDSPPTVHNGLVLFGSADGWVYCLRSTDGQLVWRFLAAAHDRRIVSFDQLESVWPVHGSVLVREGIAYVAAGRSTYLDGGIRLYALDPASGHILHRTTLSGPFPDGGKTVARDVSFFIRGANSDVLASEGDAIYMRQKWLTPSLEERPPQVLSSKGECDVGLHLFATSGFLDGSWYNRAFWMYARRWPGFQLANQAPKSGKKLAERGLDSPPVFDGIIAAAGRLLVACEDGSLICLSGDERDSAISSTAHTHSTGGFDHAPVCPNRFDPMRGSPVDHCSRDDSPACGRRGWAGYPA